MNVLHTGRQIDSRLSSPGRAILRLSTYLALTLALLPIQVLAVLSGTRASKVTPLFYHRLCARIFGFRIQVHGQPSADRPTLYVSNHVSYMDITVLGSLLDASFIAKAEVSKWPLFGQLAKLNNTVFIQRRRSHAAEQRDEISRRLANGNSLILFPEGTSADGVRVMPFKSALFSVAEQKGLSDPLTLQPISISYSQLDGIPLGRFLLPHFAWYGDMTMVPHLFTLVGLGLVTIDVTFHEPALSDQFKTRKEMAEYCHRIVAAGASRCKRPSVPLPETLEEGDKLHQGRPAFS